MNILIRELPEYEVAYIRRVGSYFDENGKHWEKLLNWAINNGLFPPHQSFIGISLDNPELVESHNCRHDACVTIPEGFDKEQHENMQFRKLDGGLYVLYQYYDSPSLLNSAYQYMYEQWLPNSDFEPDYDRYNLEFNMNNPAEDPDGKAKVHLYVPVKKRT
ncbi:GyrI-like domain-containing protein [Bacillus sp. AFS055030]|uniref:AraC family transcriptional regulator n=1 Tax=Bacillus sp. AFS055030 TaxID=2033507 RepID=UPI000BFB31D0|nr:GyrI-like domain-containing protein [Bacillus sp. AFS055030]PGL70120.1 AraC family transcriptional regulator [Bacillus sp. AFS055030]